MTATPPSAMPPRADTASQGAPPLEPQLDIDKLTLRFRGLTAVNQVDLKVMKGQIFAVIGPNGAGKTSLFNAITGIYEPTEGVVRFEGKNLQKAPERGNYVRWGLVGLVIGLLSFFLVSDINQMWAAVVKANYLDPKAGFQIGQAIDDFGAYLGAQPRIEFRQGRFAVVTSNGDTPFGSPKTRAEAEAKRSAIPEMASLPHQSDADAEWIEKRGTKFAILSEDKTRVLDEAPTFESASGRIAAARKVEAQASGTVVKRIVFLFIGLGVGVAAAWAVWRQTRRTPTSVAQRGIARTFQNIRLFQDMTVLENVLVGMDRHLVVPHKRFSRQRLLDYAPLLALAILWFGFALGLRLHVDEVTASILMILLFGATVASLVSIGLRGYFTPSARQVEAGGEAEALALLSHFGLDDRAHTLSKNLPYGAQRRLEIARALATRPRLILLDEPAAGMNPSETVELMKMIQGVRDRGVTVLLIEHHMRVVMGISDRIAVLVYGQKVAEGTPEEIRRNPKVIEADLGQEQLG